MVNVPAVEALYHELSWEAEVLAAPEGLLIDVLGGEVLSDAAVVSVGELCRVDLVVEQVVHVHIVDVSLNAL